ncbi:uncharacterized protein [Amphiura filiformis]|uniref:uncharacterized protein n=1 Tax=Amphiura filiformis TaxID=82378 RepID=UPI003B21021B
MAKSSLHQPAINATYGPTFDIKHLNDRPEPPDIPPYLPHLPIYARSESSDGETKDGLEPPDNPPHLPRLPLYTRSESSNGETASHCANSSPHQPSSTKSGPIYRSTNESNTQNDAKPWTHRHIEAISLSNVPTECEYGKVITTVRSSDALTSLTKLNKDGSDVKCNHLEKGRTSLKRAKATPDGACKWKKATSTPTNHKGTYHGFDPYLFSVGNDKQLSIENKIVETQKEDAEEKGPLNLADGDAECGAQKCQSYKVIHTGFGQIQIVSAPKGNLPIASTTKKMTSQKQILSTPEGELPIASTTKKMTSQKQILSTPEGELPIASTTKKMTSQKQILSTPEGELPIASTKKKMTRRKQKNLSTPEGKLPIARTTKKIARQKQNLSTPEGKLPIAITTKKIARQKQNLSTPEGKLPIASTTKKIARRKHRTPITEIPSSPNPSGFKDVAPENTRLNNTHSLLDSFDSIKVKKLRRKRKESTKKSSDKSPLSVAESTPMPCETQKHLKTFQDVFLDSLNKNTNK